MLNNVNIYFIIMIIFSALWVIFVDVYRFKKTYKLNMVRKSRFIGITFIVVFVLLFAVRKIIN